MRVEKNPIPASLEPEKVRKKRGKLYFWLMIIIVFLVIIPVIFIGVSGIFRVPVISTIFNTANTRDLGVKVSDQALASLQNKVPTRLIGLVSDFCLLCQRKFEGEVQLNTSLTSEEVTSFLDKYFSNDEIVSGLQVKMVEGGLEISSFLKKPVKVPVYVKVEVTSSGSKSVNLKIEQAKIGLLPVPEGFREKAQKWFQDTINKRMGQINGFSLEKLEYHEGYGDFVGTFPQTVVPAAGYWLTI